MTEDEATAHWQVKVLEQERVVTHLEETSLTRHYILSNCTSHNSNVHAMILYNSTAPMVLLTLSTK